MRVPKALILFYFLANSSGIILFHFMRGYTTRTVTRDVDILLLVLSGKRMPFKNDFYLQTFNFAPASDLTLQVYMKVKECLSFYVLIFKRIRLGSSALSWLAVVRQNGLIEIAACVCWYDFLIILLFIFVQIWTEYPRCTWEYS